MYFILSINTRTNSGKIVKHATTLEEAIVTVTECAREYVLNKSEPLLHRAATTEGADSETRFYSSNSQSSVHQIDVFKQKIDVVKGWLGTTQVSHTPTLVRRFMYCSYPSLKDSPTSVPLPPPPPPVVPLAAAPTTTTIAVKRTPKTMPTGGFPANVLDSLIENTQFQRHRQTTDNNVLSGMFTETDEESD